MGCLLKDAELQGRPRPSVCLPVCTPHTSEIMGKTRGWELRPDCRLAPNTEEERLNQSIFH